MARGAGRNLLGCPLDHNLTTRRAALRPHVDDPVGRLDYIEIMLDHQHRVAHFNQPVEDDQQRVDVGEVQSGRRLIENIECAGRRGLAQYGGQFDALRFAARKRVRRLSDP